MSGVPAWARKGAKVVCIDAPPPDPRFNDPVRGQTYTIREVQLWDSGVGLLLVEVTNRGDSLAQDNGRPIIGEVCFGIERFRPIVGKTQAQDIAQFTGLLKEKEHENA